MSSSGDNGLRLLGWAIHAAGVLSLVLGGCGYYFVVASLVSQRQQRNEQEALRLEELVATKQQVEREYAELSSRLKQLQQRAETMRDRIPDEPHEAEFLQQVTAAATDHRLKIRDYQTGSLTSLGAHSQIDVRLQGEGDYRSICGFLERISLLPRVTTVQRLQLSKADNTELYPLDMTLTLYFAASRSEAEG